MEYRSLKKFGEGFQNIDFIRGIWKTQYQTNEAWHFRICSRTFRILGTYTTCGLCLPYNYPIPTRVHSLLYGVQMQQISRCINPGEGRAVEEAILWGVEHHYIIHH